MTKRISKIAAAAMAALFAISPLAADPPNGGTIAVEPKTADGEYDPSTQSITNAVDEALASKGFTILDDSGHAAYVAELILSRTDVGTAAVKGSSGGAALTPGGAGAGVGVAIPLSTGDSRLVALQRTRIEMRIRKRGGQDVVWHGAAVTVREAGTKKGADDAVAAALSEALLRAYPAVYDEIGVP